MSGAKLSVVDGGGEAAGRDWRKVPFPERMLELYARVAYMQKGGTNAHFKYKFLQESEVKGEINQACRDLFILIANVAVQPIGECSPKSASVIVAVTLADALATEETRGHTAITLQGFGAGVDSSDKGPNKAFVSAYKYAFMGGLAIKTGDDPESTGSEGAALEALLEDIEGAESVSRLNVLKGDVGRWSDDAANFRKLKAAWTARLKTLQGGTHPGTSGGAEKKETENG